MKKEYIREMILRIIKEETRPDGSHNDDVLDQLDNDVFRSFSKLLKYVKNKYPSAYKDILSLYNETADKINDIYSKHDIL